MTCSLPSRSYRRRRPTTLVSRPASRPIAVTRPAWAITLEVFIRWPFQCRIDSLLLKLRIDPADPIDNSEPADPNDRIEPADPIDRIDPAEPIEAIEPADPIETTEATDDTDWTDTADVAERCDRYDMISPW
jgi:hypothetical protein